MDYNEAQGRWILTQGWLSREHLAQAYAALAQHPQQDLCGLLLARGWLTQQQAAEVRGQGAPLARDTNPIIPVPSAPVNPSGSHEIPLGKGQRVGSFEILGPLSQGAMGQVFRARHAINGRNVALKVMQEKLSDATDLARFQREAKGLVTLDHPNIVKIEDYGELQGRPFLAMELVEGRDLRTIVRESIRETGEPPPIPMVAQALSEIASALSACHEAGLIHRDVKPDNILIEDATGRAVLVDFGLLRPVKGEADDTDPSTLTRTDEIVGTPAYMSPEQFAASQYGAPGPPTDVWSLGATLFYALTGEGPFPGKTLVEILQGVLYDPPRRASSYLRGCPPEVDELILACLEKPPEARPGCDELAERLDALRAELEDGGTGGALGVVVGTLAAAAVLVAVTIGALVWAREDRPPAPPVAAAPTRLELSFRNPHYDRVIALDEGGSIVGEAAAPVPAELLLNGKPLTHDKGRFVVDARGYSELTFEAGRGADRVRQRYEIVDADDWAKAVADRLSTPARWSLGSDGEKRAIAESIARGLGGDWRFEALTGGTHGLAALAKGEIVFHLIPGGRARFGVFSGSAEEQRAYRAFLAMSQTPAPGEVAAAWLREQGGLGLGEDLSGLTPTQLRERMLGRLSELAERLQPRLVEVEVAPFLLARTELTRAQWAALGGGVVSGAAATLPATGMSATEAEQRLGAAGLRLPDQWEWQYACTAASQSLYFWGDELAAGARVVWFGEENRGLHPVSDHAGAGNAFGLLDIIGNAREWAETPWRTRNRVRADGQGAVARRLTEAERVAQLRELSEAERGLRAVMGPGGAFPLELAVAYVVELCPAEARAEDLGLRPAVDLPRR